eukprot:SAG25_NODE_1006_length_4335_cov_4.453494_3_plen_74_part_00
MSWRTWMMGGIKLDEPHVLYPTMLKPSHYPLVFALEGVSISGPSNAKAAIVSETVGSSRPSSSSSSGPSSSDA